MLRMTSLPWNIMMGHLILTRIFGTRMPSEGVYVMRRIREAIVFNVRWVWVIHHFGLTWWLGTCPTGDDPLTTGQTEEIQLISCLTEYAEQEVNLNFDTAPTAGTFILALGTGSTRPIAHNAAATGVGSVQEQLETLVASATVTQSTTATSRNWQLTFPSGNTAHNYVIPKWHMAETQSFICAADAGSFAITYGTETALTGIAFDADTATIAARLETLSVIGAVSVAFETGVAACSAAGNVVTITFSTMRDKTNIGNLPELVLDKTNGGDTGLTLGGLDAAFLDTTAKEVVRGIDTCRIEEVQSVVCTATSGLFSLSFDGTTVSNIAATATVADLKASLETIASVMEVSVAYSNGTTACTEHGNTITVTFVMVTTLGAGDGDLNEITTDITNGAVSPLAHTTTDNLALAATFTEVTKGTVCTSLDVPYSAFPQLQMFSSVVQGGGSFKVSFRGQTTASIPAESSAYQVEQYLSVRRWRVLMIEESKR